MPQRTLSLLRASALLLAFAAAAPAAASADLVTVDFESGAPLDRPITTEYRDSRFVTFTRGEGFRPYRRLVDPRRARSGTTVADVGSDVCQREVDDAIECELPTPGTTARLTRSASSVVVHAGQFDAGGGQPVTVALRAYRADGREIATGSAVTIDAEDFKTAATVSSAAADIARVDVVFGGRGVLGAAVGIDDLAFEFPDRSLPDVSLSGPTQEITIPQGGSVDVPIAIGRLNGSRGPLDLSATRLTQGVRAQFVPDPVPGAETEATLRLSAAADAPTLPRGGGRTLVVSGDPGGVGAVAPAIRTLGLTARVAAPFTLSSPTAEPARVPTCTATTHPLRLERDLDFRGTVSLSVSGLPSGVRASFDRSEVPAQGGLIQEVALRLEGSAIPAVPTTVTVTATSPGAPLRTLAVDVVRATPTATVATPVNRLLSTPQLLRRGTDVRLTGNGFCPGTVVRVGQAHGEAPTVVEPDGRGLRFTTPRGATSGPIVVVAPDGAAYPADQPATVRSYRNTHGLRFANFPFGHLSFDELIDAFGKDDILLTVDPCPIFSCPVTLPTIDWSAAIVWPVLNEALKRSGGHCFGFSLATQRWLASPITLNAFSAPERFAWSIPRNTNALTDHLDVMHALQGSTEFLVAWLKRSRNLSSNVERIRSALASGNPPSVFLTIGGSGHVVVAHDLVERSDGGVDVHVYDSNTPFLEDEDGSAALHAQREQASVITISPGRDRWQLSARSGGAGALAVLPRNAVPSNPSLPGIGDLGDLGTVAIFASADGAARLEERQAGSDFLPLTERPEDAGSAGVVFPASGERPAVTVRGTRAGSYRQVVASDDAVASLQAPTAKGVRDTTAGLAGGDGLSFAAADGAPQRRVTLQVATSGDGGAPARSARVETGSSGGGRDSVRLAGGRALVLAHAGAPTTASFTLTGSGAGGGPVTFVSGPLRIADGETVTAAPQRWSSLERVRVTVRDRRGATRVRTLRNRARVSARVTIPSLTVKRGVATARVRLSGLPKGTAASGAIVLQGTRGGRALGRRTVTLRRPRNGTRTVRWTLPAKARGRGVRIVASATVVTGG
ncbi:MAG TPA: hypothetical protein VLK58_04685, partial [Conexibacter sp.]|nr:hypothetical protein [Conexibacter sp.]